jgi:transposase
MELAKITSKYYCGVDLHDKKMYICITDKEGKILLHKNVKNNFEEFKKQIKNYRDEIAVGIESTHNYYWLYDGCRKEGIEFHLGHAYYLRAIRGKKKKDDKIDSKTLSDLMRSNFFPVGYAYPAEKRETRDLLRRRNKLVKMRAGIYNHLHLIHSQQCKTGITKCEVKNKSEREAMLRRFEDGEIKLNLESDLELIKKLDEQISIIEKRIKQKVKIDDKESYSSLLSFPGIGPIIALTILYETNGIERFGTVQKFSSYCRVVKTQRESNGKRTDNSNQKIGNPHLKWSFSQASVLMVRYSPEIRKYFEKLMNKMGKNKARAILRHKIAIAVYYSLKNKERFNLEKFLLSPKDKEKAA